MPAATSRNAQIADAVAQALNAAVTAGSFGATRFTAVRRWLPMATRTALKNLKVTVFPAGEDSSRITRARDRYEIVTQIGIQQALPAGVDPESDDPAMIAQVNAAIDAHALVVEQVSDLCRPGMIAVTNCEYVKDQASDPLVDPTHLLVHKVMTSRVDVTFQLIKPNP